MNYNVISLKNKGQQSMLRQFIIVITLGLCTSLNNSFAALTEQDIQSITQKAVQGDADAQFNLGAMYYNGLGVNQDYAQAQQWYEKAAQQGFAKAQYNLGYMYDIGQGIRQDYAQARQWYEKAAQQGVTNAQFALGIMYDIGQGIRQDYAQARQWYEKAAQQDDANAQYNLGVMYYNGSGVSQDYAQARQWFEKAAQQGHASSQHILDLMDSSTSTKTIKQNDSNELSNKSAKAKQADEQEQDIIAISIVGNSKGPNRVIELLSANATMPECTSLPGGDARKAISYSDTKTKTPLLAVGCWTLTPENIGSEINLIWKDAVNGKITRTRTTEKFFNPWVATATALPNQKVIAVKQKFSPNSDTFIELSLSNGSSDFCHNIGGRLASVEFVFKKSGRRQLDSNGCWTYNNGKIEYRGIPSTRHNRGPIHVVVPDSDFKKTSEFQSWEEN